MSQTLIVGTPKVLNITSYDANNTLTSVVPAITTSDATIASLSAATGNSVTVTPLKAGTVTITITVGTVVQTLTFNVLAVGAPATINVAYA